MPIGPAPKTIAVPPGSIRERSTPLNATAIGSTSAPCASVIESARRWMRCSGTAQYSARPPPAALSPIDAMRSHISGAPATQREHAPQLQQGLDADPVADTHGGRAVTHGGHDAGELVTHHLREHRTGQSVGDGRHRGGAREVLVQVGPADAVVRDTDQHLAGRGLGFGDVLDANVVGTVQPGGEHGREP